MQPADSNTIVMAIEKIIILLGMFIKVCLVYILQANQVFHSFSPS